MSVNKRVVLSGLNTNEYEHSLDKTTLEVLRKIPILPRLIGLVQVTTSMTTRYSMLGSDLRITERQFPTLYRMFREACDIMEMPEPLLYVTSKQELNAFTACPDNPIIRIYSSLLDIMQDDEIMFVLGHELAHIKSQHIVYTILGDLISTGVLRIIASTIPGLSVLYTPAEISLNYAFYEWMRASEYTCDRGGFLACQSYEASCRALMKLAGYSNKYVNELNLEEFLAQTQTFGDLNDTALGAVQKILLSFGQTHPWAVLRVRELIKFKDSGDYDKILRREMPIREPFSGKSDLASDTEPSKPSALSSILPKDIKIKNPFKK
ncbi:MAG: M48 family metallopeptidase [Chitinispirillia bacterium]|nr:M48 family metallopeptidase [Chitinispirillia bacterium]